MVDDDENIDESLLTKSEIDDDENIDASMLTKSEKTKEELTKGLLDSPNYGFTCVDKISALHSGGRCRDLCLVFTLKHISTIFCNYQFSLNAKCQCFFSMIQQNWTKVNF